jgi:hypothetical protein
MDTSFTFPLNYGLSKTGLPLIVVKMFGKNICLLLDTGSNQNIIDHRLYKQFKARISTPKQSGGVIVLNGNLSGNMAVKMPFIFDDTTYQETFICTENVAGFEAVLAESEIPVHGILGNCFLLKHGWIIDFDKVVVYAPSQKQQTKTKINQDTITNE